MWPTGYEITPRYAKILVQEALQCICITNTCSKSSPTTQAHKYTQRLGCPYHPFLALDSMRSFHNSKKETKRERERERERERDTHTHTHTRIQRGVCDKILTHKGFTERTEETMPEEIVPLGKVRGNEANASAVVSTGYFSGKST